MTAPAPEAARRPGRPRDARADTAIMDAAVAVLADRGPAGFTVDEVAARAGCGKATIYRRWPSRAALLLDTAHRMGLEPPVVDTGTLRGDVIELLVTLAAKLRDTAAGRILPGVIAEASVNPEMSDVLRRFVRERRVRPRVVVERGIARGELPADTDVDLLVDTLGGTVMYRELIAHVPLSNADIETFADHILAGFGATPAS
jgi:AcrR family transcriptional regulator